jgi:hypothetical protein
LQEFLTSQEVALALLRRAAAMPGCWFEHDYFQASEMLLPELEQLRHAAIVLSLDARARAAGGDGRGALEDVTAMLGMARHINDPVLISVLVAMAIERNAVKTLEEVLALTTPPTEPLTGLPLADGVSRRREVQRACQMEDAAGGVVFSDAPSSRWLRETTDPVGLAVLDSPLYRVFLLPDDLASYHRTMKEMSDLAGRPYYEARQGLQELEESFKVRRRGILTMLLIPAVDKCAAVAAETDAAHRLARLAVAVTAYRAKHGNYPDRLEDLAPAVIPHIPVDPFDGKPLRLKREGDGLVLYSVGRDGKDDGGAAVEAQQQGDLVFRLR